MAGVLSFALGLETSAFAAGLDRAGGRLLAFLSVGKLVSEAIEGVTSAIERGGALTDLSARTGTAVGDLYQLQEAFSVVGISADALPAMINRFNKSLSGVGEMGENTTQAFSALGLSVADLKKMDAPKQIEAVASQLAQMPRSDALDVAQRLFGRGGGDYIMQISGDLQGFRETLAASAREAAVFARNAAAFDKLGDTVTRVKGSLSGMFAGIAEGIVPTLQGVVDTLNSLDLVAIGQDIGTMFSGAFQAFREGKLSMLIADTVVFGFQAAVDMLPGIFAKIGTTLLRIIETPLIYIQTFMEWLAQKALNPTGGQSFDEILAERKKKGAEFFTEGNNLDAMNQAANDSMAAGMAKLKQQGASLFAEFADFASRAPQGDQGGGTKRATGSGMDLNGSIAKPNVSALEKIGFVFNGGSALDPVKQTAQYTRETVNEIKKTNLKLDKLGSTGALVNK